MKEEVVAKREKPQLDEETFQQLLAAAYVLQEEGHQAHQSKHDFAQALVEIVETQNLIQTEPMDLGAATALIAQRVRKITRAAGVAIGLLEGEELVYRAAAGSAANEAGFRVPASQALAVECVKQGQILEAAAAEQDRRLSLALCRERGIKSLVALPVLVEGKVAGVLELWFADNQSFQEHDRHTCQLMAGLVTTALARAAEMEWKQALAVERATMLETLERLKPQLERLSSQPSAPAEPGQPAAEAQASEAAVAETPAGLICRGCGHELGSEESFCGLCGTARVAEEKPGTYLQSKWASMWHMQQAAEGKKMDDTAAEGSHLSAEPAAEATNPEPGLETPQLESTAIVPTAAAQPAAASTSPWTSATRARVWLESLRTQPPSRAGLVRLWAAHRATLYLVAAAILLLLVLSGWVTRPAVDVAASGPHGKRPAAPQLSFFDTVLVNLGLAEAPPPPIYLGNPSTQVWVDVQHALYYCPGADLYGKTPDGKFASQREAQQDQFEPAFRKPCD